MNRAGHDNVDFFCRNRSRTHTSIWSKTLFVVGLQPIDNIAAKMAGCEHIFFGANHSFDPNVA
jgi:hypothetical protein